MILIIFLHLIYINSIRVHLLPFHRVTEFLTFQKHEAVKRNFQIFVYC